MAVIQKEILLAGSKGKKKEVALFDSGATYSCIQKRIAKKLETVLILSKPMYFETAKDGEKVIAKECVRLDFYIGKYRFSDEFMIIENLSGPVIIVQQHYKNGE